MLAKIKSNAKSMHFVVTTTTRPRRGVESQGVHYRFVSREKFEGMIKKKELLERGESKGSEGRYLRMRRGTIDGLRTKLDSKIRALEQQRHVLVDYEEVCAGIVEVIA